MKKTSVKSRVVFLLVMITLITPNPRQLPEHDLSFHRPTIVVFLDIRQTFDLVNGAASRDCLLSVLPFRKLYVIGPRLWWKSAGSCHLSISSGIRQYRSLSPFLFNFAINDVPRNVLHSLANGGVELLSDDTISDFQYVDTIALLNADVREMQHWLATAILRFCMHHPSAKCFTGGNPHLILLLVAILWKWSSTLFIVVIVSPPLVVLTHGSESRKEAVMLMSP